MGKPKLFIASSKERLPIARLIQELLAEDTKARVWDQGLFGLSKTTIENLLHTLGSYDFALFVLAPDDLATIRSDNITVTRDNVIFELGLFMGRLGPERTFILVPQDDKSFHLPADLLGVVAAKYDATARGDDLYNSLGPACNQVRRAMQESFGSKQSLTLQGFLEKLNFSDVTKISIVAYTGSSTVRAICEHLERVNDEGKTDIELRVALRSRFLSDAQRAEDIKRTSDLLEAVARNKSWVKPEVRYYGAPALLRSLLVEHKDGSQSAYLSYYDWSREGSAIRRATSNTGASHTLYDSTSRSIASVHQSWFSHYWGAHKIHTVIFDFDDTLFTTSQARIEAWRETIFEAINFRGLNEAIFTEEIQLVMRTNNLSEKLRDLFFDEQDDVRIAARIFKNPNERSLDWTNAFRAKRRAELTLDLAEPMPGLIATLQELGREFQLGIVTGTDEKSVKTVLRKHNLLDQFTFILGREAPKQAWAAVEVKTQNLLRAANLLGIPLDRIVFVGDDDADYTSAKQLGMHFIENRGVAFGNGRTTLIRAGADGVPHHITGFEGAPIRKVIDSIAFNHDWIG